MRVGILELLRAEATPDGWRRAHTHLICRQYASIMPQALGVWSRRLGHETFYATYFGQQDPFTLLPADLDVVFLSTFTRASHLAYALARLYGRRGVLTVIGGPHAGSFPEDCRRFFDVVVGPCDRTLFAEILRERPRGVRLASDRPLRRIPSVQERLPEIRTASFWRGLPFPAPVIGLLTSVGCPYRCDFCTDWDKPYALLPLEDLETDLRFISRRLPRARVGFHDPNFAMRFDEVMDVMERIPREARVRYLMETSLSVLREDRLRRLRETGCWYTAAGVESWSGYASKTVQGRTRGRSKLERVLDQLERVGAHVPVVQANFIFGIDADAGEEPVELTREFIRRAPHVWPNLCIPTPFGGTPLYAQHRREGRLLTAMPFSFYNAPYLVTLPRHYSPAEYYEKLEDLLAFLTSAPRLLARLRARPGYLGAINALRVLGIRDLLGEVRRIRDRLRLDPRFRAFHEGRQAELPAFYRHRCDEMLGPYAELLSEEDRRPVLPEARAEDRSSLPAAEGP